MLFFKISRHAVSFLYDYTGLIEARSCLDSLYWFVMRVVQWRDKQSSLRIGRSILTVRVRSLDFTFPFEMAASQNS